MNMSGVSIRVYEYEYEHIRNKYNILVYEYVSVWVYSREPTMWVCDFFLSVVSVWVSSDWWESEWVIDERVSEWVRERMHVPIGNNFTYYNTHLYRLKQYLE